MSSPIATSKKSVLKKSIINLHKKLSHSHRIAVLGEIISKEISSLRSGREEIKILDIGCGDMSLIELIQTYVENVNPICLDIYPLPGEYLNDSKWQKYKQFDGQNIPYDGNYFDFSILSDVLHHDFKNSYSLLKESLRVSHITIIKDHFQKSFYSRLMLKFMDIIGNWGYGVALPKNYFTEVSFQKLLNEVGAVEIKRINNIELYSHNIFLSIFLKSDWQFISIIKKK
ncbi:methyltransferase domain-containing protein [Ignavibacterium sp.]|uniref:methyltransferase domain-containing protein n=1 Tax=Ignavibacterium sp. TaxID=2651167 RepID=UPI0022094970|nr:methyltransferase domain-containing protein [Ignavibacterium sp.]BDQ02584.1 MAG: hypothetical protein KatS3mg037_1159 [Ignavibacterium sp.]